MIVYAIDRIFDFAKIVVFRIIRMNCKNRLIHIMRIKVSNLIGKNEAQALNQLIYILKKPENEGIIVH